MKLKHVLYGGVIVLLIGTCLTSCRSNDKHNKSEDPHATVNSSSGIEKPDNMTAAPVLSTASDDTCEEIDSEKDNYYENSSNSAAGIVQIKRSKSGLDSIKKLDFGKYLLNKQIEGLLNNSIQYENRHFSKGIVKGADCLIISERYTDKIIQDIGIGTDIKTVKSVLGSPSISFEDLIFYKTKKYYLGFKGYSEVEQAIISNNPKEYNPKILGVILEELNKNDYIDLNDSLMSNKEITDFIDSNGHINGGGWYADSLNGINIHEFDDNRITVFNNFEGELFKYDSEKSKFDVVYKNEDHMVNTMSQDLKMYMDKNKRFETEGLLSPGRKLKCIYDWEYSMSQYFTIRTLDFSRPDFRIHVTSGDYKWINDHYLLYIHSFYRIPYAVKVSESDEGVVNILYDAGILKEEDPDSIDGYEFKIKEIKGSIITLEDAGSKKTYKIKYAYDSKGSIKFSKY
jgi:hypothetical protein